MSNNFIIVDLNVSYISKIEVVNLVGLGAVQDSASNIHKQFLILKPRYMSTDW